MLSEGVNVDHLKDGHLKITKILQNMVQQADS